MLAVTYAGKRIAVRQFLVGVDPRKSLYAYADSNPSLCYTSEDGRRMLDPAQIEH